MSTVAIISGTGSQFFPLAQAVPESQVRQSKWGAASGPLAKWSTQGHTVLFLARHGEAGSIPPHRVNYRANIQALLDAGAEQVIALNAVGGISPRAVPGSLAVPDQLIDYTWGRAHSYFDAENDEQNYIDFTEPYSKKLRKTLIKAGAHAGLQMAENGVYGVTQGPRLETAAEIDRMERDGCTLVGMTSMPEASLAREAGLEYACLALVVNRAAGRGSSAIHQDIERFVVSTMSLAATLLEHWLAAE